METKLIISIEPINSDKTGNIPGNEFFLYHFVTGCLCGDYWNTDGRSFKSYNEAYEDLIDHWRNGLNNRTHRLIKVSDCEFEIRTNPERNPSALRHGIYRYKIEAKYNITNYKTLNS